MIDSMMVSGRLSSVDGITTKSVGLPDVRDGGGVIEVGLNAEPDVRQLAHQLLKVVLSWLAFHRRAFADQGDALRTRPGGELPQSSPEQVQALPRFEPPEKDQVGQVRRRVPRWQQVVFERVGAEFDALGKLKAVLAQPMDHVLAGADEEVGAGDRFALRPCEISLIQRPGPEHGHAGVLPLGRRVRDNADHGPVEAAADLFGPDGPESVCMPVLKQDAPIITAAQVFHERERALRVPSHTVGRHSGLRHVVHGQEGDAKAPILLRPIHGLLGIAGPGEQDIHGPASVCQGARVMKASGADPAVLDRSDDIGRDDEEISHGPLW